MQSIIKREIQYSFRPLPSFKQQVFRISVRLKNQLRWLNSHYNGGWSNLRGDWTKLMYNFIDILWQHKLRRTYFYQLIFVFHNYVIVSKLQEAGGWKLSKPYVWHSKRKVYVQQWTENRALVQTICISFRLTKLRVD